MEILIEELGYCKPQLICIMLAIYSQIMIGIHISFIHITLIPLEKYFNANNLEIEISSSFLFLFSVFGFLSLKFWNENFSRRKSLILCSSSFVFSYFLICITTKINLFTALRCFASYFISIFEVLFLNSLLETLPLKGRNLLLFIVKNFYNIGQSICVMLIFIYTPNLEGDGFKGILVVTLIFFIINLEIIFWLFKTSPRNLVVDNNEEEALTIIKEMCSSKGRDYNEIMGKNYIAYVRLGNNIKDKSSNHKQDISFFHMFDKKYFSKTVNFMILGVFCNTSFFGQLLIFTLAIDKVKDLYPKQANSNSFIDHSNTIQLTLISCVARVIVNTIASFLVEIFHLRMKTIGIITYSFACLSTLMSIIDINNLPFWLILNVSLLSCGSNTFTNAIQIAFPTNVRDVFIGFLIGISRLGSFSSQFLFLWLFTKNFYYPYYFSIFLNLGSLISFYTTDDHSSENIDKIEENNNAENNDTDKNNNV